MCFELIGEEEELAADITVETRTNAPIALGRNENTRRDRGQKMIDLYLSREPSTRVRPHLTAVSTCVP